MASQMGHRSFRGKVAGPTNEWESSLTDRENSELVVGVVFQGRAGGGQPQQLQPRVRGSVSTRHSLAYAFGNKNKYPNCDLGLGLSLFGVKNVLLLDGGGGEGVVHSCEAVKRSSARARRVVFLSMPLL